MGLGEKRKTALTWTQRAKRTLCSGSVDPKLFAVVKSEFEEHNRKSLFILTVLGICEGVMLVASNVAGGKFGPSLPSMPAF